MFDKQTSQYSVSSLLLYDDEGDGLRITDYRSSPPRVITLDRHSRSLYLACEEVSGAAELSCSCPELPSQEFDRRLDRLLVERLVFHESGKYLSLAIPANPLRRMQYPFHASGVQEPINDSLTDI
jgi:hypothetical protein